MAGEATDIIKTVNRSGDNYYAILGVDRNADDETLKKAYRKLALRLHPDKCSEEGAEEAFKKVGEAFSILSDSTKRQQYDAYGADGLRVRSGGGGGAAGMSPDDLFQAFFGGGGANFARGGMGGAGFQTFTFTSGGPGGRVFHFQTGSGQQSGGARRRSAPQQEQARARADAEKEPEEVPAWAQTAQLVLGSLGPLLPFVIIIAMGLFMALMGTILQFIVTRGFLVLPILTLTQGRTKAILLASIAVLAMLGIA